VRTPCGRLSESGSLRTCPKLGTPQTVQTGINRVKERETQKRKFLGGGTQRKTPEREGSPLGVQKDWSNQKGKNQRVGELGGRGGGGARAEGKWTSDTKMGQKPTGRGPVEKWSTNLTNLAGKGGGPW